MNSVLRFLAKFCLVTVFALLTSCEYGGGPVGPQVPPASTGPVPTAPRCEEDDYVTNCFVCSPADDSCDETSY